MARPRFHALVTVPVAWMATRRWGAAGAVGAIGGGLLIDVDHLIDYGWTKISGKRTHYFAPLHGWELSLLLVAAAWWTRREARAAQAPPDSWVVSRGRVSSALGSRGRSLAAGLTAGAALGSGIHLVQDVLTNRPEHLGTYLILFRAWHRFERQAIGWGSHPDFQGWSGMPWHQWF